MKKKNFKKISKYFLNQKKSIIAFIVISLVVSVMGMAVPFLSAALITALTNMETQTMLIIASILFALAFLTEILGLLSVYISDRLRNKLILAMKIDATKKMFTLETKNFDKEGTGFFTTRLDESIHSISRAFFIIRYNFTGILTSVGVLVFIFVISWQFFVLFIVVGFLRFAIDYKRTKHRLKQRKLIEVETEKYSSNFTEVIRGIRDIKVLNIKDTIINKTIKTQEKIQKMEEAKNRKDRIYQSFYFGTLPITEFLVILLGIYLIGLDQLSAANLLVIFMYRRDAIMFLMDVERLYSDLKDVNHSVERLFEVIDGDEYPKEKYGKKKLKRLNGKIELKNVNFSYNDKLVLNDVNMLIKPNQTIGFVGKSGGGKTTLFNIISKLYSTKNNQIYFDDVDINDLSEKTLRSNISIITQDPYIFNMSIRENLMLVKPDLTEEEMIEKSKLCALHDIVETLEEGYDTVIGENGVKLSGGQKQRLAIARALIKDSEIILLDEATSALDNETQSYIQESIRKISKDYTILIIAHRLSTVKDCDYLYVIDEGEVVGQGTHDELMKKSDKYQMLYQKEMA